MDQKTGSSPEAVAVVEPLQPVVDRPGGWRRASATCSALALVEPQEGLGTASLLGHRVVSGQVFQLRAVPGREIERSHQSTCDEAMKSDGSSSLQRLLANTLSR